MHRQPSYRWKREELGGGVTGYVIEHDEASATISSPMPGVWVVAVFDDDPPVFTFPSLREAKLWCEDEIDKRLGYSTEAERLKLQPNRRRRRR
jgi:hypothetical protein